MRNISFRETTEQIRNQTKTVTRRIGWRTLKPGTLLQPVVKAQGLKRGERIEKIGQPIRVVSVRRERLAAITEDDCTREGFPTWKPYQFIEMFLREIGGTTATVVTRIEFTYTEDR